VNFPLGHQTGKPGEPDLQRRIVTDAMRAFDTITTPETIVELPYVWDPSDRTWETRDYTRGWMPQAPPREIADSLDTERIARYSRS
jgi:hypothetical protein